MVYNTYILLSTHNQKMGLDFQFNAGERCGIETQRQTGQPIAGELTA